MNTDSTTHHQPIYLFSTLSFKTTFVVLLFFIISNYVLQAQNCPNVDFSSGSFANWQGRTGACCPINLPTAGIVAGRHTIIAAPGVDPNTGGGLVLPAPGFTQVARLGNAVNGAQAEGLSYTILVDPTNALFIYTYAVVLEEPGHTPAEQPRFELQVRDQFNNIIPCTYYEVAAGVGVPGFQNAGAVVWKNWEQVGVDLSAYMGQTVTIEARTGDCDLGGHFGYGYIVGQCQPLEINLNFCSGATSANLTAPNGFASYLWSTGETTQNITIVNPTIGQVVTCTVTSVTGCQAILSSTLNPILVTGTTTSTNVTCAGGNNGSATVTATGGSGVYTYNWAPSGGTAATATNLTAGNYTVTITESGNLCTGTATVTITQPTPINVTGNITHVNCFGGNTGVIDITPTNGTPGYTYNWSNGSTSQDISLLTAGNYNVTVTDAVGCTATYTGTVNQTNTPLTSTMVTTNVACFGGTDGICDITPTGGTPGYSYLWNTGATTQDINSLSANNYSVTITDALGCTTTANGTITQPTAINIVSNAVSVPCFGGNNGSVTLNTSGGTPGYTFLWSNGATTQNIVGLTAGTYSVTATDANGCTATSSAFISQPLNPITVTGTFNNIDCFGNNTGAIDVTVSGGTGLYGYLWSSGNTTQDLSALFPGTYSLTVTDINGCSNNSFSATITQPAAALNVTGTDVDILCFGGNTGTIDITPTGGTTPYTYNWNNGANTQDIGSLTAGVYNVTVTDANGCTNSLYTTMISQPASALTVTGIPTQVLCYGMNTGSINLSVNGGTPGYNFIWNNGSTNEDQTNLPSGNYSVTVTDANGCINSSYNTNITQPFAALLIDGALDHPTCNSFNDGSINVTMEGGTPPYTFQWNTGPTSEDITLLSAGNYNVTVTDGNGCTTNTTYTIIDPPALMLNPTVQPTSCYGIVDGSILLSVTGGVPGYNFLWNNNSLGQNLLNVGPGNYSITVTDQSGCTATSSYIIPTTPPITVDIDGDSIHLIWLGESVDLEAYASGGTGDLTYTWGPDNYLSCTTCQTTTASPLLNQLYAVTVTDVNGCTAIAGAYIELMYAMYVPNTFTPNGDGENDEFFAISASVKEFSLRIFDRWGEEVFTTHDIHDGWDGIYRGSEAKQDVYVFRIEAKFLNGKYEELVGQVNLLR